MRSAFARFSRGRAPSRGYFLGRQSRLAGYLFEELVIRSKRVSDLMNRGPEILAALNRLRPHELARAGLAADLLRAGAPAFTRLELLTDVVDGSGRAITDLMVVAVDEARGVHWVVAIGECKLESVVHRLFGADGQFASAIERMQARGIRFRRREVLREARGGTTRVRPGELVDEFVPGRNLVVGRAPQLDAAVKTRLLAYIFLDSPARAGFAAVRGLRIEQVTKADLGLVDGPQQLAAVILGAAGFGPR
jgi:hypothetical protein